MADSKQDGLENLPVPTTVEPDRELSVRATGEFEHGDYNNCVATLRCLVSTRAHDLKVAHNLAVATYYSSCLKKTDEFKQSLDDFCMKVSLDEMATPDDVDHCIIYYNHAVVLYYKKQYKAGLAVLDKVMHLIESIDEYVSRKVAFLMVELYLATYQPYKALGMLAFIDKSQFGNGKSSSPDKDVDRDDACRDIKEDGAVTDLWRLSVSEFKIRCFLMLKSVKSCKREIKSLVSSSGLATAMVFLKSQFECERGNYQKAVRMLISNAHLVVRGIQQKMLHNVLAMYYNDLGILHFHMRKHHLGAFYLRHAIEENANAVREVYKSEDFSKSSSLSGPSLHTVGVSCHYEIMYNLGIELLHCSQPQTAFDCLLETIHEFQVNPCLWLRLAECCVMVHRMNNDIDRSHSRKMEVVNSSVGSGLHRKLILGTGLVHSKSSFISESPAIPTASMEFAALCLDNALLLLSEHRRSSFNPSLSTETTGEPRSSADATLLPAPPCSPLRADEVASLRCSVLACRAYVALYHHDYLVALQYAEILLQQQRLSGAHRYLAHMYLAEALVALDHIADGIDHLNPDRVTDICAIFPVDQKQEQDKQDSESPEQTEYKGSRHPWSPGNVMQAKAIMVYNLAATHAIRGEHEKALQHIGKITQMIGQPLPAQMYYLKIYLELLEGRRKVVHSLLRDHYGHVASSR